MKKALARVLAAALVMGFFYYTAPVASAFTLYQFTSHTFTTCGKNGRIGPSLESCTASYSTTWDQSTDNFTVVDGIQYWTVPFTGRYYIDAYGAGSAMNPGSFGGYGARIADTFDLTQGEVIRILVGQAPNFYSSSANLGGGGTFVTRSPHNTNGSILVIAGGGGASESATVQKANANASITQSGNNGSGTGTLGTTGPGAGGTNGGGGGTASSDNAGGGGGGFLTNGATNTQWRNNGGTAYVNGGLGSAPGAGWSNNYQGGFGGGGGALGSGTGGGAGGGGGYSGGGGGDNALGESAGGGGSYFDNGLNINRVTSSTGRSPNYNGYVVITALSQPSLSVSVTGNATSVSKGQNATLTANVNQSAQVTFFADGKKISKCINLATSGGVATCTWKPTIQKSVFITASIVIGNSVYVTSPRLQLAVTRRTGARS